MDTVWRHPFTSLVVGPTKSGKTEFVKKFVANTDYLIDTKPQKILWCYSEYQPSYDDLVRVPNLELIEGIPDISTLKGPEPKLVVFDDFMAEFARHKKSDLTSLFTRGCHHWNTSVVHIVQNLFYDNLRTARINSHYMVLLKNPSDRLQVMNLGRQLYPDKQKYFNESYNDACAKPYGYLLIDMSPETADEIRLRCNIFPNEISYAYLPK